MWIFQTITVNNKGIFMNDKSIIMNDKTRHSQIETMCRLETPSRPKILWTTAVP